MALGSRADYWLEILGEGDSLMRLLLASFSLFLLVGGCASLEGKCVNLQIGDSARADIIVGPWASISIQGPGSWSSAPESLGFAGCQDLLSRMSPVPTP